MTLINALNALGGHVWAFALIVWLSLVFAFKYKAGGFSFFVEQINLLHDNVLAIVILGMGVLVCRYDKATGGVIIAIAATVWNNKPKPVANGNGNGGASTPSPAAQNNGRPGLEATSVTSAATSAPSAP